MENLTCQCRHDLTGHDPDTGKCRECPCTTFALIYGSIQPSKRSAEITEKLAAYFKIDIEAR